MDKSQLCSQELEQLLHVAAVLPFPHPAAHSQAESISSSSEIPLSWQSAIIRLILLRNEVLWSTAPLKSL